MFDMPLIKETNQSSYQTPTSCTVILSAGMDIFTDRKESKSDLDFKRDEKVTPGFLTVVF